ncbi:MAG: translocation/assembly module TamB domain-containing protein [Hyphomonadaceae bacterium]
MSDDAPAPPKKKRRNRALAYAAGGVFVATGAIVALGPAAPWLIDNVADGQRVWRLGRITVDGVSGGWLGALRAERVAIEDEHGVWLEAHNLVLDWRPQSLAFGAVRLDRAHADRITLLRQPTLLERRPSSGADFDVRIGALDIDTIDIAEPVLGESATLSAAFFLDISDGELNGLNLDLRRLDSQADRALIVYRPDENYELNVDISGDAGGVLSRVLGAPDQSVRATATGRGDAQSGEAEYSAMLGEAEVVAGTARWSPTQWSADARGRLDVLPRFDDVARRIGEEVSINASGARVGAFRARAQTNFLTLDLEGVLTAERELDGGARFVATASRLSDIARESPFELGAARLTGELRSARGTTAIHGELAGAQVDALGARTNFSGPVRAALTQQAFTLVADLSAAVDAPPLFARGRLLADLEYNRARSRFELSRAELTSDALAMDARGWINGGDGEFSGGWRIRQLQALAPDLRGQASGRWRAFADENTSGARVWIASVDGAGAGIGGAPDIVPQLLGAAPRLNGRFISENGGITVSQVRVEGAKLRAGATGRIVSGQANLAIEATARGPITLGDAEIAGAADATGRLTGRLTRPSLTARANVSSFSGGGVVLERPTIEFSLAPQGDRYVGRAEIGGTASGQPLIASSNVAFARGGLSLSQLDARWGALQAQGEAAFGARGVTAELEVTGAIDGIAAGATGNVVADVSLAPQSVRIDAQITDARADELRVRAATLHAAGPLNNIAATFDMRGRLREAPLSLAGTAAFDAQGEQALRIEGRGVLADADVFTRAPILMSWRGEHLEASLNVALGDGVVSAQWIERRRALSGTAQIEDAPLAPLAAIWGERAEGRIDGDIALSSDGGGLSGNADLRLDDARLAGRQRGRLDMHIVGDLDPSRLRATIDANSTEGLIAHFEADAPVETSATPIRIALARERRGAARWSVHGPAASLWAAARLQDQTLEGQLDGEGELEFGAGYLSGDGHIEIIDGRFEDKLTGVTLTDLDARVALDDRGVTIENFTATAPGGGRLTATGGSATPREGRIAVNVENMLVANRPDARARASGDLTLAWEGLESTLTGALNIIQADLDIAANPEAGIPTLDVVEINAPGAEEDFGEAPPPRRNGSTRLDVTVTAPGRVFTRGRGIEAEWSLNMRLTGTASAPQVHGRARAVRGTLALSGQPFEIEEAIIDFDGDPLDARIDLTAVRDTADLTARIRLLGTAREPEITFTSDPALPEDEILPQVLFGRSVADLSAFEAAQLAASLATLSGRTSFDLMDAARAAVGLDRFNVRQGEDGGILVAGGVYLTRDVYVEVARTGLGQAETRVEWTVRPRLVLITSFLGNGDQRVSLRWRRETD